MVEEAFSDKENEKRDLNINTSVSIDDSIDGDKKIWINIKIEFNLLIDFKFIYKRQNLCKISLNSCPKNIHFCTICSILINSNDFYFIF